MNDALIRLHSLNIAAALLERGDSEEIARLVPGMDTESCAQIEAALSALTSDIRSQRANLLEHLIFEEGYQLVPPDNQPQVLVSPVEETTPRRRPGPKPGFKKKAPQPETPEPAPVSPEPVPVVNEELLAQARRYAATQQYHLMLAQYAVANEAERGVFAELFATVGKRATYSRAAQKYILTSIIPEEQAS